MHCLLTRLLRQTVLYVVNRCTYTCRHISIIKSTTAPRTSHSPVYYSPSTTSGGSTIVYSRGRVPSDDCSAVSKFVSANRHCDYGLSPYGNVENYHMGGIIGMYNTECYYNWNWKIMPCIITDINVHKIWLYTYL